MKFIFIGTAVKCNQATLNNAQIEKAQAMAVAHNQTFHIKDAADRKGGLVEVYLYDTTMAPTGHKLICTGWDESPHSKEFNVDDFFRLYEKELKRCLN